MPFEAVTYKVLIASPSDVKDERELIPATLNSWNIEHSEHHKVVLLPIRWETNAFPTLGVRPQEAINQQLTDKCDLLVGAFWTRFGTPTGVAGSGTAEEIERFRAAQKPVMLYFSRKPVDLESVETEQYEQLKAFKKRCLSDGLAWEYRSLSELEQRLYSHLTNWVRNLPSELLPVASPPPAVPPMSDLPTSLLRFAQRMRVEWRIERESDPLDFSGASHILSKISYGLQELHASLTSVFPEDRLEPLIAAVVEVKKAQQEAEYAGFDFDWAGLWKLGEQILGQVEDLANSLREE